GDMLSASPVLGAAVAAGVLGGSFAVPGALAVRPGNDGPATARPCYAVAAGYEAGGSAGEVLLKSARNG
ncbi:MAG: hypothetical protein NTW87_36845, partial [Planctomycetota bacterium]|nr:hypothetical protein [Planctomycetota bacterium]